MKNCRNVAQEAHAARLRDMPQLGFASFHSQYAIERRTLPHQGSVATLKQHYWPAIYPRIVQSTGVDRGYASQAYRTIMEIGRRSVSPSYP